MSKPTPGPWLVVEGPPACIPVNRVDSGPGGSVYAMIDDNAARLVASYTGDMDTAHLIADAPALLDALEKLHASHMTLSGHTSDDFAILDEVEALLSQHGRATGSETHG